MFFLTDCTVSGYVIENNYHAFVCFWDICCLEACWLVHVGLCDICALPLFLQTLVL